jgi:hypothetical protein
MVYPYVIVLKNQHNRYIDILGILLSIFSVACFTREMLVTREVGLAYLLGVIFVTGVVVWNLYQTAKKKKVFYSRALLIAALVWMKMSYFSWLFFPLVILALLEYQAKYAIEIGFSDRHILINSLLKKKYQWTDFNNVVLKDGWLTLDFANNRVLQREIDDDEEDEADEDEFNVFCQQQLDNSRSNAANQKS